MLEFMKREINAGHQCYIVCPLVETNEEKGNFEEATNKKKKKSVQCGRNRTYY